MNWLEIGQSMREELCWYGLVLLTMLLGSIVGLGLIEGLMSLSSL